MRILRCLREHGLFVVAAEAVQDLLVVGAQDEVDDFFLWDVVGVADDEVGHQVFAQKPAGVVVADAEHGAEFREGHHIRVGTETPFIILSCHDRSPSFIHVIARPVRPFSRMRKGVVVAIRNPHVERTDSHTSDTVTDSE